MVDAFLSEFEPRAANYGVGQLGVGGAVLANRRQRQMLAAAVVGHLEEILALKEDAKQQLDVKKKVWQLFDEEARVAEVLARTYETAQVKVINSARG